MSTANDAGLTIWGRLSAFNVQKVVWAADEVGRPYRRIDAGRGFGVTDTTEYLSRNPNGRVPLIQDGDFVLWESNVIVRYLCARYGQGLYPEDLRARMDAERWMDWQTVDVFNAYRATYNVLSRGFSDYTREQAEASFAKTVGILGVLDERLATRAFVAGDRFTMADIPLGVQVHDLFMVGREITGLENVKRWYAALKWRPGARAAMAALPMDAAEGR
jgi:glutathione S-transferase